VRDILDKGIGPENESARLENLKNYILLYTDLEPAFDQLAALTATIMKVPIAIVSYVDGFENGSIHVKKHSKDTSFCSIAVLKGLDEILDKIEDPCMLSNPLVASDYGLRFYAATPITTTEGLDIGTLCILDDKSRVFTIEMQEKLERIAVLTKTEIEKKRTSNGPFSSIKIYKKKRLNNPSECYF